MAMDRKRVMRLEALDKIDNLNAFEEAIFNVIHEHVGPLGQWPAHNLSQIMSTHLVSGDRINLTLFLLGNSCPPDTYAEWLLSRNMLKDNSARNQVAGLIESHKAGRLTRFTCYKLPYRVTVETPKSIALTVAQQKKMFDSGVKLVPAGYGDPIDRDSGPSALIFPVETPKIMDTDGWRWDFAVAMLKNGPITTLPHRLHQPQVQVVPMQDPDDDDGGMYAPGFEKAELLNKWNAEQQSTLTLTAAVQKARGECSHVAISELFG